MAVSVVATRLAAELFDRRGFQAQIVAADLDPAMLEFAPQRVRSERVAFESRRTHRICHSPRVREH
jgi:hypothetical protein